MGSQVVGGSRGPRRSFGGAWDVPDRFIWGHMGYPGRWPTTVCTMCDPEVRETWLLVVTNAFYGFNGIPKWLGGLGDLTGASGGGRGVPDWCLTVIFWPIRGKTGCENDHLRLHADRAIYVRPGCSRVMGYIHWSYQ